jgi:hypothetical protein
MINFSDGDDVNASQLHTSAQNPNLGLIEIRSDGVQFRTSIKLRLVSPCKWARCLFQQLLAPKKCC